MVAQHVLKTLLASCQSTDDRAKEHAAAALANFALGSETRRKLLALGALIKLVDVLKSAATPSCLEFVSRGLVLLTVDAAEFAKGVLYAGGGFPTQQ